MKFNEIMHLSFYTDQMDEMRDFYENKLMIRLQGRKKEITEENEDDEREHAKVEEARRRKHDYIQKMDPSKKIGLNICSGAELKCIAGGATCKIAGNHGVLISSKKISDKEIFYLMSRGLSEEDAKAMIVRGFAYPISKELPVEYAVEMNNLINLELQGAIG
jgi:hypothetical protein